MRNYLIIAANIEEARQKAAGHFRVTAGDIDCRELAPGEELENDFAPLGQGVHAGSAEPISDSAAEPASDPALAPTPVVAEESAAVPPAASALEGGLRFQARVRQDFWVREAREWVNGLMERFGAPVEVHAELIGTQVFVRLAAPDPSILIGKQGHTLEALQHVAARALVTRWPYFPEIILDVEGYKEKKYQRLERTARQSAARAIRSGQPQDLEPMTASERKYIHNALKDIHGVRTSSHGREPDRHIVCEPTGPADPSYGGGEEPERRRPAGGPPRRDSGPGGPRGGERRFSGDPRGGSGDRDRSRRNGPGEDYRRAPGEGAPPRRVPFQAPGESLTPRLPKASADEQIDWNPNFFRAPDAPYRPPSPASSPNSPNSPNSSSPSQPSQPYPLDVEDDLHS